MTIDGIYIHIAGKTRKISFLFEICTKELKGATGLLVFPS